MLHNVKDIYFNVLSDYDLMLLYAHQTSFSPPTKMCDFCQRVTQPEGRNIWDTKDNDMMFGAKNCPFFA